LSSLAHRGPPSLESSGYGCGRRQSGATPSGPPQQAPVRPRESAGWGQAALPVAVSLPGPEQDVTDRRFRAFHSSTRVVAARILTRETATATARPPTTAAAGPPRSDRPAAASTAAAPTRTTAGA